MALRDRALALAAATGDSALEAVQPHRDTEVELAPVAIPEWEAEDISTGVLDETVLVEPDEAAAMLGAIRLTLPADLVATELVGYAGERKTPLEEALRADIARFDFHLLELPLNILVPDPQYLVRLRLKLDFDDAGEAGPVACYDLFPTDSWEDRLSDLGNLSLDVGKALTFFCPAPVADVLGLELSVPLKWRSRYVTIRTTGRMSNPVEWYVTDRAIQNGFTAYAIVRAPKGASVEVAAVLACELRTRSVLGRLRKARYASHPRTYRL
jgi:hypothetical protein